MSFYTSEERWRGAGETSGVGHQRERWEGAGETSGVGTSESGGRAPARGGESSAERHHGNWHRQQVQWAAPCVSTAQRSGRHRSQYAYALMNLS